MDTWQEDEHPWLVAEKRAIQAWVEEGRPYLGICPGAQLLAIALGGEVRLMAVPEVGPDVVRLTLEGARDGLPRGLSTTSDCFQWHGAEMTVLPTGARHLLTGNGCHVQGFSIGARAYGLQYHLELTDRTVQDWGGIEAYARALERLRGSGALDRLEREVATWLPALRAVARTVFTNFVEIARGSVAAVGEA